jgi:hypothetical protein
MEPEDSLLPLQKPTISHYAEHCCMTGVNIGWIFGLTVMRTKSDIYD